GSQRHAPHRLAAVPPSAARHEARPNRRPWSPACSPPVRSDSPSSGVRGSSTSLPFLVPCGPAWLPDRWWNSASDCATILALQARPFTEWGHMPLSFAVDILDLSSYEQVKEKAPEIYATLEDGSMRCDEHWPKDNVGLFKRWMDEGMAA